MHSPGSRYLVAKPPMRQTTPAYPSTACFRPADGAGVGGDPVDLASGDHTYVAKDLSVYNPYGPNAIYLRNFCSARAEQGYSSPGLAVGWVDTYDAKITPDSAGSWSSMTITYPNGAQEKFQPVLDSTGQPTGGFGVPTGSEDFVTGSASASTGAWNSITMTFKDETTWIFLQNADSIYKLAQITNPMGRYISIVRDAANGYRLSAITDDSTTPVTLLAFSYQGAYLSSITDAYGRKLAYTFGSSGGSTNLLTVSRIADSSASSAPAQYTYGYTAEGGQPRLTSVSFPSPAGSQTNSVETINYIYDTWRAKYIVGSMVDANGNQSVFSYESPNGTRVQIENSQGSLQQQYIENFDPARANLYLGRTDAAGYNMVLHYADSSNPDKPTTILDKNGRSTTITYDQYGNVLTLTDTRGITTTNTYAYTAFSLGRLTSVREGSKTPTMYTYCEPSGLVHSVTCAKPGTTNGPTVTASFTYDGLGNVVTKTSPGRDDSHSVTTTCNYTTDGTYSQPAMLGQPLTVTDNLGHTTHFRYDPRGNVVETTDAIGNTSDFTYNIADQMVTAVQPGSPVMRGG